MLAETEGYKFKAIEWTLPLYTYAIELYGIIFNPLVRFSTSYRCIHRLRCKIKKIYVMLFPRSSTEEETNLKNSRRKREANGHIKDETTTKDGGAESSSTEKEVKKKRKKKKILRGYRTLRQRLIVNTLYFILRLKKENSQEYLN